MAEDLIAKTAIATSFGLWEFVWMPLGLKNAAQTFQRLMDSIFQRLDFVFVYLDHILVASKSPADHLGQIFTLLSSNGLIIQKSKCIFGVQELAYLGHLITVVGVRPLPSSIEAIRNFPTPNSRSSLQRFLGMINFYHRFLPQSPRGLRLCMLRRPDEAKNLHGLQNVRTPFKTPRQRWHTPPYYNFLRQTHLPA